MWLPINSAQSFRNSSDKTNAKESGSPASDLLDRLEIPKAIEDAGATVIRWDQSTLDAAYDLDCGITDVYAAVAETGSLVIRPAPGHGRAISLVPPIHVAIVEPGNIVPDLIDLFEKIAAAPRVPNITIITGPSKTADIEGAWSLAFMGRGWCKYFWWTSRLLSRLVDDLNFHIVDPGLSISPQKIAFRETLGSPASFL